MADAGIFFYYGFHSGTNMGEADKIAEALSAGRIADEMRSVDVNPMTYALQAHNVSGYLSDVETPVYGRSAKTEQSKK